MHANKTLFTKAGSGPDLAVGLTSYTGENQHAHKAARSTEMNTQVPSSDS